MTHYYAQNGEDVRLMRAFAGRSTGFYVDVGANHPTDCSVTKCFYDAGWRGINVEPQLEMFDRLAAQRPRDVNLNVGCGSSNGPEIFYKAPSSHHGLSTFYPEEALAHMRNYGLKFEASAVCTRTLNGVLAEHAQDRQIDFLSVDVEGYEEHVLSGIDLDRFRPRVILVEAVRPNTQIPSYAKWEYLLLARGYLFSVFDGLNRFYVRDEDAHLSAALVG